jgi:hypothetical protein
MLSPDDIETIAERTVAMLAGAKRIHWVDPEVHADDHGWVAVQRKREQDFIELRQKILTSACIWAVPIILAFVLSAFWRELLRILKG